MEGFHGYTFFILDVRKLGFYGGREKNQNVKKQTKIEKKIEKKIERKIEEKQ